MQAEIRCVARGPELGWTDSGRLAVWWQGAQEHSFPETAGSLLILLLLLLLLLQLLLMLLLLLSSWRRLLLV